MQHLHLTRSDHKLTGHLVWRMTHERAQAFRLALIERLSQPVSILATVGLTCGLLRAGFAPSFSGGPLRDSERVVLSALYYCEDVWKVSNNHSTFRSVGLPVHRNAVGELLGLEPGDRDKGSAAFDQAGARTDELGLAAALELFEEALRLRPDMPAAWANTGSALREAGRGADAITLFERAIAAFGPFERFHEELTLTLVLRGDFEAAVAAATVWLDREPCALLFYNRGCAHAALNHADLAVADLARCVRLDESFYADLANDADLDPLRGHSDFQALLAAGPRLE